MLKHHGFDTSYLLGAPAWQTCTALLIQRILDVLAADYFEVKLKGVIVVTGSRDATYIKQIVESYPSRPYSCRVVGFSEVEWIPQLPVTVITPVPMSHVLGVEHVIEFTDHAE
jgi:hypothetical protein